MDDETKQQLTALQSSVDLIGAECHDIRKEQSRTAESHKQLHREHNKLVERIEGHERKLLVHITDYSRQQEHNATMHAHMTGATMEVKEELKDFRGDFRTHVEREDRDRKEVIRSQKETIRWIIGTAVIVLLALLSLKVTL